MDVSTDENNAADAAATGDTATNDEGQDTVDASNLSELITDENQQVAITISSSKEVDGDLFDVTGKFADGTKCHGEMLSSGGRIPAKGQEWKVQVESRKEVPTRVTVLDKNGKPTKETEIKPTDRKVIVGYFIQ